MVYHNRTALLIISTLFLIASHVTAEQLFNNEDGRRLQPIMPQSMQENNEEANVTVKYLPSQFENLTYYVIPHSHTDAGWWLTFSIYYFGRAKPILSSTYNYLNQKYSTLLQGVNYADPSYERLVWADFAFFMKWWNQDTTIEIREEMKQLVDKGLFGIEHGGMVQHDEALSDYKSIIIMFDSSLQFIKENFENLPKLSFSIDGFGHSSLTPYLLKALGYEGVVVYRMPYELASQFENDRQYFFNWEGDNQETIKVYRLKVYSLIEQFNLEKSKFQYDACFRSTDECAEMFIDSHVIHQTFNKADDSNERIAFQTFGTDFSFQNAKNSYQNVEVILDNLERYSNNTFKYEFATFSQLHEKFNTHKDFNKVLQGDMFIYDEKNGDNWSGYYGSKPDLKMHIKQMFNKFRAVETLLMVIKIEHQKLSMVKISNATIQEDYSDRQERMKDFIKRSQAKINQIRNDIAILLHHDAITGTNAQAAEKDWMSIMETSQKLLNDATYDLVANLGKSMITSKAVDFDHSDHTKINLPYIPRWSFQIAIFNPQFIQRNDLVTLRVNSNNIQMFTNNPKVGSALKEFKDFDLIYRGEKEYDLVFNLTLMPLELQNITISENETVGSEDDTETLDYTSIIESMLDIKDQYVLNTDKVKLVINFNTSTNHTQNITFQSKMLAFTNETLTEELFYYNGDQTHSCMYIFNPLKPQESERSLKLMNITTIKTKTYEQIRFNYEKQIFPYNKILKSKFSRIYTVYFGDLDKASFFNVSYIIQNLEHKEFFIGFKRAQSASLYADNSAFNLLRNFNSSFPIGKNTYPYVNGLIWDASKGNVITMVSNRAGGVSVRNQNGTDIALYLNRNLNNINYDKGLYNRLDDITQSRTELIFSLDNNNHDVLGMKKKIIDIVNDPFLVIEAGENELFSSYDLATSKVSSEQMIFDLDYIDILHYNESQFLRVRNYREYNVSIAGQFNVSDKVKLQITDENLLMHCLEAKKEKQESTEGSKTQYMFEHRKLMTYEETIKEEGVSNKGVIEFKPYEMKCLRLTFV